MTYPPFISSDFSHTNPSFEKKGKIELDREAYTFLIQVLNRIINHINAGRLANAETLLETYKECEMPNDLEICKAGKSIQDYMYNDVKEYWDFYVNRGANKVGEDLASYIDARNKEK